MATIFLDYYLKKKEKKKEERKKEDVFDWPIETIQSELIFLVPAYLTSLLAVISWVFGVFLVCFF